MDKTNLVGFFENLDTETGFACAHRLPLTYTTEEGLNWSILYRRYKTQFENSIPQKRVLSQSRWGEYRRVLYPRLRTTRSMEDRCNVCERIRVQLRNPDLDDECRGELEKELEEHLAPAQSQRKV